MFLNARAYLLCSMTHARALLSEGLDCVFGFVDFLNLPVELDWHTRGLLQTSALFHSLHFFELEVEWVFNELGP